MLCTVATRTGLSPMYSLPISKLRGVSQVARVKLKSKRITNCDQLLEAAGKAHDRERLAAATTIDPAVLLTMVQRADMARVNGIGAIFGMMLEDLEVRDVQTLAACDPARLHEDLRQYNRRERLARRSPTDEEVADWVAQARVLEPIITY